MANLFQLPIAYLDESKKELVAQPILTDLELQVVPDKKSLYEKVFLVDDLAVFAHHSLPLWQKYYTADRAFLVDSQQLLKNHQLSSGEENQYELEASMATVWQDILNERNFADKYHYIEYKYLEKFNSNAKFMQIFSLYNMTSPVFSLMLPLFFLIMPFFILKMQGIPITVEKFVEILKYLFKRHQIGQIFNVANGGYDKIIYAVVSLIFYVMQVYQNIMSCRKFYDNMKTIHHQLITSRTFIEQVLQQMSAYQNCSANLKTYEPFLKEMLAQKTVLEEMQDNLAPITPHCLSVKKCGEIGYVMKTFYDLNKNESYKKALEYAFGFTGYVQNLSGLKAHLVKGNVAACTLLKKDLKKNGKAGKDGKEDKKKKKKKDLKTTHFVGAYFPALVDQKPVKNSYSLEKHGLITGPNAAGKTTLLKTTLMNILLTQQTGYGFYKSAALLPYDVIHCYINIPDTSARDSLFQAEARRCKDILTAITLTASKKRHFCIFDELYSGTNPYEAIGSAYAFLQYLNKHDNATFMITTHYLALCQKLDKEEKMQNYLMEVLPVASTNVLVDDFKYTYRLLPGISNVKGGIKVLQDLEYPAEIIANTRNTIKELFVWIN